MIGAVLFVLVLLALLILVHGVYAEHTQRFSDIPSRIRTWQRLFQLGPSNSRFVAADDTRFKEELAGASFNEWYNTKQGAQRGDVTRIPAVLDNIGRLSFTDKFEESRLVDTSRFCLNIESVAFHVEFIPLGRRWCMEFDEQENLRCQGHDRLTCHLAVHTHFPLSRNDEEAEQRCNHLFDHFEEFKKTLRDGAEGTLRHELAKLDYREAMYAIPDILDALNRVWEERNRKLDDGFSDLMHVEFTGLIISPIAKRERIELRPHYEKLHKLKEQCEQLKRDVKAFKAENDAKWNTMIRELDDSLKHFEEHVPLMIQRNAEAVARNLINVQPGGDPEAILLLPSSVYSPNLPIETECKEFVSVCRNLGQFVGDLRLRESELDDKR